MLSDAGQGSWPCSDSQWHTQESRGDAVLCPLSGCSQWPELRALLGLADGSAGTYLGDL